MNHQNKFTHPHPKRNFVPLAVVTKSGQVPVNTAKQSSPRAAATIIRRAFNQKSAAKTNNLNEKVKTARVNNVTTTGSKAVVNAAMGNGENVVKSSACWIWRPTGNVIDHTSKDSGSYMLKRFDYGNPQYTLQDQGIFNSGCSRHMTGNKSFLTDYQKVWTLVDLPKDDAQEVPDEFYEGAHFLLRVAVKTTSTPIETNKALLKDVEAENVDVHLYRSMIGLLMHLTASRTNIMC
ncbi:hypothetical protein Tco_0982160 [Tanacetum coccineum]